jgi:hypothetical protein
MAQKSKLAKLSPHGLQSLIIQYFSTHVQKASCTRGLNGEIFAGNCSNKHQIVVCKNHQIANQNPHFQSCTLIKSPSANVCPFVAYNNRM